MLGLPPEIRACLFDLDGVLTQTARLHAIAWKTSFDDFLQELADEGGPPFKPFDIAHDYNEFVDGKPRLDGVRSFLASRTIKLPEGAATDPTTAHTIEGLGRKKNELFLRLLRQGGAKPIPGSKEYVRAVRAAGLRTAVVSSSKSCREVLDSAGMTALFDARIDGVYRQVHQLPGKPAPDTYVAAAAEVGCTPSQCAVFEDALSGVEAGRAGKFGYVVGVDRRHQADALRAHGADVVVSNLSDLLEAGASPVIG